MELQENPQQFYQIVAEVANYYLTLAGKPLTGAEITEQMFDLLRTNAPEGYNVRNLRPEFEHKITGALGAAVQTGLVHCEPGTCPIYFS